MTTATGYTLYKYQSEAKQAVFDAWAGSLDARPAIILPTGTGKTVVFSSLVHDLALDGQRAVILVHRDELVQQTVAKLASFGGIVAGIVKAEQNDTDAQVIVASVQTLFRAERREALAAALNGQTVTVVVDELHHYTAKSYRAVLETLGCYEVGGMATPAVGFTATFTRTDSKHLANDWTPVYEKTINWAIEHGYLCDLEAVSVRVPDLELGGVRSNGSGDLADLGLGKALQESSADEVIPAKWLTHARDLRTILFAPTIASCEELIAGFARAGVKAEAVYGGTPLDERRAIYDRVRAGITKVLGSVGVLTEGFDMPEIECAVLARPTESRGLYQQMVGRVLRTFPGKDKAILLDVIGNTEAHDLCNVTDLTRTHDGHVDQAKDPSPCNCGIGMGGLCLCETRGNCTRSKNMDLCLCSGCDCPRSGERGKISFVKGSEDVHVDVFKGSGSAWLQTYAGTWFLGTRSFLVAVLPVGEGLYAAARTHSVDQAKGPGMAWLGAAADIETAMADGQRYATMADPHIVSRDSKWRRRKAEGPQLNWAQSIARRQGYELPEGVRKGPCSDLISRDKASAVLGG